MCCNYRTEYAKHIHTHTYKHRSPNRCFGVFLEIVGDMLLWREIPNWCNGGVDYQQVSGLNQSQRMAFGNESLFKTKHHDH